MVAQARGLRFVPGNPALNHRQFQDYLYPHPDDYDAEMRVLEEVAHAFGFARVDAYLDRLAVEGPNILTRLPEVTP